MVNPYYWAAVLLATSAVEGVGEDRKRAATVTNADWLPGDLGFDPLGFYPSDDVRTLIHADSSFVYFFVSRSGRQAGGRAGRQAVRQSC